jgi:2-oxoacid dehydrogenases acyltransferase (catalytic domain)
VGRACKVRGWSAYLLRITTSALTYRNLHPMVNYPQYGMSRVGRVAERPVIVSCCIAARCMMYLKLFPDHRIIDDAPAAMFLQKLKERLEGLSDSPVKSIIFIFTLC